MIEDGREIPQGTVLQADVVVIGSGAAGIPCACEFIGSGQRVVLLESGGFELEPETQELAEGAVADPSRHGPLAQYRKRVFGGTTSVWGGRCAPFDSVDFSPRSHVPFSGWPLSRDELVPYYRTAHRYLFTGDFDYEAGSSLEDGREPVIPGLRDEVWCQDQIWRFSLPAHLGREFKERLAASEEVKVLLHSNALKLATDPSGERIESVEAGCLGGGKFRVAAPVVIVAAGGLESTRLLLLSDDVHRDGLGNAEGQLGRYYGSHLGGDFGEVQFNDRRLPVIWQYQKTKDGVYAKRQLRIRESVQRREGLLNMRCILTHPPFADASHGNGVLSAAYLAKRFFKGQIPPEYSKELAASGYHHVPRHLRNVLLGLPGLGRFSVHWALRRTLARRKYPSISLPSRRNAYTIHFDSEQAPNPESRVSLGDERDAFGQRRLLVDWKYSRSDLESAVRCGELLREELAVSGVGAFRQSPEELREAVEGSFGVGSHHIGTTRMSESPRTGVVDPNCQLHGVRGLYVASPSSFPTGGFANPVLTTVALALRIAHHVLAGRGDSA